MTYGLEQVLHGLAPGEHWVRAEFVATDHLPFRNEVSDSVTFTVG
jgi:hypothetical protein